MYGIAIDDMNSPLVSIAMSYFGKPFRSVSIEMLRLAGKLIEQGDEVMIIDDLSVGSSIDAYEEGFKDMRRRKPNIDKIFKFFRWKPKYSLDDTLKDIIRYEQDIKNKGSTSSFMGN